MTSMIGVSVAVWFKLYINADDDIDDITWNMESHEIEY